MTRDARTLLVLFLSVALIASGAESKKKAGASQSGKSTPKPTPAATSKTATAAKSSPKPTASSPKPKSGSSSKRKTQKPTPAAEEKDPSEPTAKKPAESPADADAKVAPTPASRTGTAKAKSSPIPSEPESVESKPAPGPHGMLGPTVASLAPESLAELKQQPEWIQRLIRDALDLTNWNLGYLFGSADPKAGGMDCSGTIYYLLREHGFKDVPRDSRGQYDWLNQKGTLRTVAEEDMAEFDFRTLRPGDLLFWTGTYSVNRDHPISHVMLYLGKEKATGKPVMWGASDGRAYAGKQRFGVSVFDFKLPRAESKSRFVGFGQLPGMGKM
jgi:peptidoglycan DL-endopeptidase CwlO